MSNFKKYILMVTVLFAVGTLESQTTQAQIIIGANKPPLLVYPNPQQVLLGQTLSVKPKLGLSDNTGVASVSVSSITPQTFTGNVTVNTEGIVTISNPGTPGTFVIAIRAVDTQGSITIARFRLKVRTVDCMSFITLPEHPLTGINANKRGPVVGDFNNDGEIDLIILEEQAHGFSILLGDGAGHFAPPSNSFISTPKGVVQGEAADFNRDGFLDLALRTAWGFIIAQGNGAGGFSLSADIAVANPQTYDMTVGDFNNDGRPDVAFTYALNNDKKLYVYLNRQLVGWGQAPGSPKPFSHIPWGVEGSDFNNDGKLDLAVQIEQTVFTYLGDGTGAFNGNLQLQFPITPGILVEMVAADLNHDGNDDLAISTSQQALGEGTLEIHLGLGNGAFISGQTITDGAYGRIGLIAPDLDSDGSLDLTAGIINGSPFVNYRNDGYGFFQYVLGSGPYTPFSGSHPGIEDFNGDGETDVVSVNYSGQIAVMLHSTCAPTFNPATIEVARCEAPTVKTLGSVVSDDFSPQQLTVTQNSFIQGLSFTNLSVSGNNVVGLVDATANAPLGTFGYWIMVTNPNNQWIQHPVTVNIVDCPAAPLSFVQPANINASNSPDSCGALVNYATPQTTGGTGSVSVVCTPPSGSNFPIGSTTVNCTATDQSGAQASTSFQVNVSDTQAPQFVGLSNITVDAAPGQCSAQVNFNVNATDNCAGVNVITSPASGSVFPAGTTQVTATATDASGNVTTATFNVTVNGSGGPTLSNPVATPNSLWPPNHAMKNVDISYTATAGCGGAVTCVLSVTSNEPVNSGEDGDTGPDWQIINAHKVRLRAERSGAGTGRIYTITVTCTDAAGNQTIKTTTVTVPL